MKAKIYTMSGCPWCVRAKQILQTKNYQVEEVVLVRGTPEADVIKQEIQAKTGVVVRTLPQIFLGEEYVGGCTDLAKKLGVNLGC
jgi:glutaredoxin 3